jgi:hypothetical protein
VAGMRLSRDEAMAAFRAALAVDGDRRHMARCGPRLPLMVLDGEASPFVAGVVDSQGNPRLVLVRVLAGQCSLRAGDRLELLTQGDHFLLVHDKWSQGPGLDVEYVVWDQS